MSTGFSPGSRVYGPVDPFPITKETKIMRVACPGQEQYRMGTIVARLYHSSCCMIAWWLTVTITASMSVEMHIFQCIVLYKEWLSIG